MAAKRQSKKEKDPKEEACPSVYTAFLAELKSRIRAAQTRAHVAVARELIVLYWQIGRAIVQRQKSDGWGKSVIERLAGDLAKELPGVEGFSANNLWRMRAFYLADEEGSKHLAQVAQELPSRNLPQPGQEGAASMLKQAGVEMLAQPVQELAEGSPLHVLTCIPWFHNVVLFQKLKDPALRLWYAAQAAEHGWSRAVLMHQIDTRLHARLGKAVTNFHLTLPPPQSDLAREIVKDPYNFGFLTLGHDAREREQRRTEIWRVPHQARHPGNLRRHG